MVNIAARPLFGAPTIQPTAPATYMTPVAEPSGQRWVTFLFLVQKRTPSGPCWSMSPKPERFQPPKV